MKNHTTFVCVVCQEPTNKLTCSWRCAGLLSKSTKYANEKKVIYNTSQKQEVREFLFKKYIKPHLRCEEPWKDCFIVLDFWGGGLFSDYILDQWDNVKNQHLNVKLYEIDNDKNLYPTLLKYAREKNQPEDVKNHCTVVSPFCGSLAEFIQREDVQNQHKFDFIWLDYCGIFKEQDLVSIKEISNHNTVVAITSWLPRGMSPNLRQASFKQQKALIEKTFSNYFPYHILEKTISYDDMGTYLFKVPSYMKKIIPKEVKREGFNEISGRTSIAFS